MTTLVLLVLAVVWGVVLVSWIRSRAQASFGDPVGTFRRHLTVLEHAAPSTVRPANRLRVAAPAVIPPYRPSAGRQAAALGRQALVGRPPTGGRTALPNGPVRRPAAPAGSQRRRQAAKRRRDVFFALVAGAVGSLLLALIPGLHSMFSVQIVFDLALAAYVALLVRMRNLAAERDIKLTYLAPTRAPRSAGPRTAVESPYAPTGGLMLGGYSRAAAN